MIDDFRDVLREFVAHQVIFLVVGAHALAVHGIPRATGDLDVLVQANPGNAARVLAALASFGAPLVDLGISLDDFVRPDVVAQLGLPPYRIDILTSISGVTFDAAWEDRVEGNVAGVDVPVLGRASFRKNKRASGRPKDLADLQALGEE